MAYQNQKSLCECGHTLAWHPVNQRCQKPGCYCTLFALPVVKADTREDDAYEESREERL
jgi:hypothetical protein